MKTLENITIKSVADVICGGLNTSFMSKKSKRRKKPCVNKSTHDFENGKSHQKHLTQSIQSTFLQRNGSYLVILLVFFFSFLLLTPLGTFSTWIDSREHTGYYSITRIDAGDDAGYYAYLRSTFFDHDIDFFNEKGYYHFDTITPTGYSINYWSIGSAILWIPFFLLGHAIALIYTFLGYQVSADGYSFPYHVLTGMGSSLCVFMGLLLTFSLLKNYFSEKAALIATVVLFLATPLPYYTFIRQRMSHAGEFLVIVFFIYSWILYRSKYKNVLGSLLLGVSAGMLLTIRLNTGIFLLIPFLDFLIQAVKDFYERKYDRLRLMGRNLLIMSIACIGVVIPQLVAWNTIMGKPYPPTSHVSFTLSNIFQNMAYVLGGRDWGIFITEPVWIFGLIGLALFIRREKRVSILFLICVLTALIICAGFLNEASFGHRFVLNCNVMLSFGVAALIDSVKMKRKMVMASVIFFLLMVWQYFLLIQYKVLMAYNDPLFAIKSLENIPKIIFHSQSILLRSTSFFKLAFSGRALLSSYVDWFFLVSLPLLMLFLSISLLIMVLWLFRTRFEKTLLYLVTLGIAFFILLDGLSLALQNKKTEEEKYLRYKQAALSSLRRGWPEKALEYLGEASVLKSDVVTISDYDEESLNKYLGSALNTQGVKYYKDKKLQGAIRLFLKAVELDPYSAGTHRNIGALYYYDVIDYEKALYHFHKSLELNPNQDQAEKLRSLVRKLKEIR